MIASGYTLDLYCDHPGHVYSHISQKFQYCSDSKNCYSEVRKMARNEGWILKKNGEVICPKCSGKTQVAGNTNEEYSEYPSVNVLELLDQMRNNNDEKN